MSLDYEIYNLGDVKLQRGATLRDCKLAYKTFGTLTGAEYHSVAGAAALLDGFVVANTDLLVKYTYNGDTDFNGIVDFDDYSHTDGGFNNHRTGWLNGDFDYSGTVDFDALYLAFSVLGHGQTSRLHKALVRGTERAESAGANALGLIGGNSSGLVYARARDGVQVEQLEADLVGEVDRLRRPQPPARRRRPAGGGGMRCGVFSSWRSSTRGP